MYASNFYTIKRTAEFLRKLFVPKPTPYGEGYVRGIRIKRHARQALRQAALQAAKMPVVPLQVSAVLQAVDEPVIIDEAVLPMQFDDAAVLPMQFDDSVVLPMQFDDAAVIIDEGVLLPGGVITESLIYPAFPKGAAQSFTSFEFLLTFAVEDQVESALYFEEQMIAPPITFNPVYRDYDARFQSMPDNLDESVGQNLEDGLYYEVIESKTKNNKKKLTKKLICHFCGFKLTIPNKKDYLVSHAKKKPNCEFLIAKVSYESVQQMYNM